MGWKNKQGSMRIFQELAESLKDIAETLTLLGRIVKFGSVYDGGLSQFGTKIR